MIAFREPGSKSCSGSTALSFRFVFLRHPQADLHGRFCGHSDPNLSQKGRKTIPGIISHFDGAPPSAVWCSDLVRARATATAIAEHFGLSCGVSAALREMNFGLWEGLSWKEVEEQFPQDAQSWIRLFPHHRPPGGETFLEFQTRVIAELERLSANPEGGCTLLVTHAGVIRAAIAWVLAIRDDRISQIAIDYGAAVVLEKTNGCWTVRASSSIEQLCQSSTATAEERRP